MRYDPVPAPSFYRHSTSQPLTNPRPNTPHWEIFLCHFSLAWLKELIFHNGGRGPPPVTCVFSRLGYNSGQNVFERLEQSEIRRRSWFTCIAVQSEMVVFVGELHFNSLFSQQAVIAINVDRKGKYVVIIFQFALRWSNVLVTIISTALGPGGVRE